MEEITLKVTGDLDLKFKGELIKEMFYGGDFCPSLIALYKTEDDRYVLHSKIKKNESINLTAGYCSLKERLLPLENEGEFKFLFRIFDSKTEIVTHLGYSDIAKDFYKHLSDIGVELYQDLPAKQDSNKEQAKESYFERLARVMSFSN